MQRLGARVPVIEEALNYVSGSLGGIVGVYQHADYGPEKRSAWQWAKHVTAITSNSEPAQSVADAAGKVVVLRGREHAL